MKETSMYPQGVRGLAAQDGEDQVILESLVSQANHSLDSMSSIALSLDERRMGSSVRVMNRDTESEIRRLPGAKMRDLVQRVRVLEGILYDRGG